MKSEMEKLPKIPLTRNQNIRPQVAENKHSLIFCLADKHVLGLHETLVVFMSTQITTVGFFKFTV